jgi:polysaccharide export outer membrane protein
MRAVRAAIPCLLAALVAGGFPRRARRHRVTLTHADNSDSIRMLVPLGTSLSPGDTLLVGERWF